MSTGMSRRKFTSSELKTLLTFETNEADTSNILFFISDLEIKYMLFGYKKYIFLIKAIE